MFRTCYLFLGLGLAVALVGCTPGPKEENIKVSTANDPLFQPRSVLERYAQGQPLGSEVTSFPKMVEDVRKVDPKRAEILEKGFEDLQKAPPNARAAKAKALLQQIQPSQT